MMNKTLLHTLASVVLGLALLTFSGCVTEPSALTGENTSYGYTWSQELELGKNADGQIVGEMGLYPNDRIQGYVTEIGEVVLAESTMRRADTPEIYRQLEFEFRVLDSSVVNAFALPGGYVYVTRGLLSHLNNEAQLAVVLGHEITHVAGRHASKQALKQQWGQIGLVAGAVIGSQVSDNPEMANQILSLGGDLFQLLSLKYGRDAERESDTFGVDFAARVGYDVGEAAEFFNSLSRISDRSGQRIPSWMSSHPDPGERSQTILRMAAELKRSSDLSLIRQDRFYDMIQGLSVGEDPRKGFQDGNVFYHPGMEFKFDVPAGWALQNEANSVIVGDPSGKALVSFSISGEATPEAAARKFASEVKGTPISGGSTRINGSKAYVSEVQVTDGTSAMNVYYAGVAHRDSVVGFLGYCAAGDYGTYRTSFARIAGSFDRLKDRRILSKEAARLVIRGAARTAAFQDLLPAALPSGFDPQTLAILNQVELDTVIQKGQPIKIPE